MTVKPTIHGRDHRPGGSDPIPGLLDAGPQPGGAFYEVIDGLATSRDLRGYWRLGEAATPFADTSGFPGGAAANMVRQDETVDYTPNVAGALPAADDDGAVQFNAGNASNGDWLEATPADGRFNRDNEPFSIVCFVRATAHASTFLGLAFGYVVAIAPNSNPGGYGIIVSWPTRELQFRRGVGLSGGSTWTTLSGGVLTADSWYMVAGTFDGTTAEGGTGTHRLYVNGALVDTDVWDDACNSAVEVLIGRAATATVSGAEVFANHYGAVDEASYWGTALTTTEIANLWAAGSGGGATAEGKVPVADGAGDWEWEYPVLVNY